MALRSASTRFTPIRVQPGPRRLEFVESRKSLRHRRGREVGEELAPVQAGLQIGQGFPQAGEEAVPGILRGVGQPEGVDAQRGPSGRGVEPGGAGRRRVELEGEGAGGLGLSGEEGVEAAHGLAGVLQRKEDLGEGGGHPPLVHLSVLGEDLVPGPPEGALGLRVLVDEGAVEGALHRAEEGAQDPTRSAGQPGGGPSRPGHGAEGGAAGHLGRQGAAEQGGQWSIGGGGRGVVGCRGAGLPEHQPTQGALGPPQGAGVGAGVEPGREPPGTLGQDVELLGSLGEDALSPHEIEGWHRAQADRGDHPAGPDGHGRGVQQRVIPATVQHPHLAGAVRPPGGGR